MAEGPERIVDNQENKYICFLCANNYSSLSNVVYHLKKEHFIKEQKGNDQLKCIRSRNCTKVFDKLKSMTDHSRICNVEPMAVYEELPREVENNEQRINNVMEVIDLGMFNSENDLQNEDSFGEWDDVEEEPGHHEQIFDRWQPNDIESFHLSNRALFENFLATLLNHKMSMTLIVVIFTSLELLVRSLQELLIKFLSKQIANFENSEVAEYIAMYFTNVIYHLKSYSSAYLLKQQFQNNECYVAPIPKMIGGRWDRYYNRKLGRYTEKFKICEFYYVPIKDTIMQLFKNPQFSESFFERDHICTEGVYHKFCCGNVYRNSEFFQRNPNNIRLQIYYDEFTLNNSKNNHNIKIGAVYMQIENIPRILNSHVEHIHLVALFHVIDLKNFGQTFNTILYPIIEDIKRLEEEGLVINNNIMFGSLATVAADNLGLHIAFGFLESFGKSLYYCHHCNMHKTEAQTSVEENVSLLRDAQEQELTFFENKRKTYERGKDAMGLKRYSLLNSINHFDTQKNMSLDMMHDLLEGDIPLTMRKFIEKCLDLNIISIEDINEKIVNFDYGLTENKNKPTEISLSESMGNSASQKCVLFLHFPFIFPELVEHELLKEHWIAMSNLLGITKICLKPMINDNDLNDLSNYITTYLNCIIGTYELTLIPKQHFLTHYVRVIKEVGPPITMWTMRYVFFL